MGATQLDPQVWRQRLLSVHDAASLCAALLACEAELMMLFDGLPPGADDHSLEPQVAEAEVFESEFILPADQSTLPPAPHGPLTTALMKPGGTGGTRGAGSRGGARGSSSSSAKARAAAKAARAAAAAAAKSTPAAVGGVAAVGAGGGLLSSALEGGAPAGVKVEGEEGVGGAGSEAEEEDEETETETESEAGDGSSLKGLAAGDGADGKVGKSEVKMLKSEEEGEQVNMTPSCAPLLDPPAPLPPPSLPIAPASYTLNGPSLPNGQLPSELPRPPFPLTTCSSKEQAGMPAQLLHRPAGHSDGTAEMVSPAAGAGDAEPHVTESRAAEHVSQGTGAVGDQLLIQPGAVGHEVGQPAVKVEVEGDGHVGANAQVPGSPPPLLTHPPQQADPSGESSRGEEGQAAGQPGAGQERDPAPLLPAKHEGGGVEGIGTGSVGDLTGGGLTAPVTKEEGSSIAVPAVATEGEVGGLGGVAALGGGGGGGGEEGAPALGPDTVKLVNSLEEVDDWDPEREAERERTLERQLVAHAAHQASVTAAAVAAAPRTAALFCAKCAARPCRTQYLPLHSRYSSSRTVARC
ncbi:hypothetical protein V8C86DRAFT_649287 [Haematococcus lacustris]